MKNNVEIYFPGWTKKSVTFTIDDGNIKLDTRFLGIVRPAGIIGTFNLCAPTRATAEEYRALYSGYEIANHCKNHPLVFDEGERFVVSEDAFDKINSLEYTAENPVVYKTDVPGVYRIHNNPNRPKPDAWFSITTREYFLRFAEETKAELEEIFGKGKIKGFVWPYRETVNQKLLAQIKEAGYSCIRKTGAIGSSTGFSLPADRMRWTYNAVNKNLLDCMAEYEAYPDGEELKFFAFGVHSYDFERDNNWHVLEEFAERYGNRPEDYYYASVSDIFEYADAAGSIVITDEKITNPTDKTVYIKVCGKRKLLCPHSVLSI
jgi:hypothetical protein